MNIHPLVSIICPTYNHGSYLGDCIQSALNQIYPYWEMLVMNDGSTDNTAEIAASFAKRDERIRLFNQDNIGIFRLAETYNKAVSLSTGKYICVLEGDDIWEPNKLQWQVKAMENDPSVVVAWGKAMAFHASDQSPAGTYPLSIPEDNRFFNDPPGRILNTLFFENPIPAVTLMIRRTALLEIGGFIQRPGLPLVDLSTLLELAKKGTFYFDERVLARWRVYENQTTKTYPIEILNGRRDLCKEKFRSLEPEIKNQVTLTEQELNLHYKGQQIIACARSGRYKLIRRDFKGARKDYIKAVFASGLQKPVWRLRAITGLVFSLFHRDVEGLSNFLGKESYRKR